MEAAHVDQGPSAGALGDESAGGTYGQEGWIYQAYTPIPCFGGSYVTIGSWVVGDEPAGIGIREDATPITCNTSHFVPHYFI